MKIIHSKDLDGFKKNHMERIEKVAKSKTEWVKEFVESQKKEKPDKTVGEMYKEIKSQEFKLNKTK